MKKLLFTISILLLSAACKQQTNVGQDGNAPIVSITLSNGTVRTNCHLAGVPKMGENNPDIVESDGKLYLCDPLPKNNPVDETANWKTYTNAQYGFEFQYPSGQIFKETKGVDREGVNYFDVNINTKENMGFKCDGCDGPTTFFKVSVYASKNDPVANCFTPPEGEILKVKVGEIIGDKCVADGLNGPNLSIFITRDGKIYNRISADNYSGEQKVLIDKILSSFKFTK